MTTIETRVQDAVLTAIENVVIPRVELAMKSANVSSGRSVDGDVLEADRRNFSGNIEGLQMTAASRINSGTDLNRIDETRDNITVEEGDLLVNEGNIGRQTHTHHSIISLKCLSTLFEVFWLKIKKILTLEKLENMMKEQSILKEERFRLFERHLHQNGKAEDMPVVAGHLVFL